MLNVHCSLFIVHCSLSSKQYQADCTIMTTSTDNAFTWTAVIHHRSSIEVGTLAASQHSNSLNSANPIVILTKAPQQRRETKQFNGLLLAGLQVVAVNGQCVIGQSSKAVRGRLDALAAAANRNSHNSSDSNSRRPAEPVVLQLYGVVRTGKKQWFTFFQTRRQTAGISFSIHRLTQAVTIARLYRNGMFGSQAQATLPIPSKLQPGYTVSNINGDVISRAPPLGSKYLKRARIQRRQASMERSIVAKRHNPFSKPPILVAINTAPLFQEQLKEETRSRSIKRLGSEPPSLAMYPAASVTGTGAAAQPVVLPSPISSNQEDDDQNPKQSTATRHLQKGSSSKRFLKIHSAPNISVLVSSPSSSEATPRLPPEIVSRDGDSKSPETSSKPSPSTALIPSPTPPPASSVESESNENALATSINHPSRHSDRSIASSQSLQEEELFQEEGKRQEVTEKHHNSKNKIIEIHVVKKKDQDPRLGIFLRQDRKKNGDCGAITVQAVVATGLFGSTNLQPGHRILSINGTACPTTSNEAFDVLYKATGRLVLQVTAEDDEGADDEGDGSAPFALTGHESMISIQCPPSSPTTSGPSRKSTATGTKMKKRGERRTWHN